MINIFTISMIIWYALCTILVIYLYFKDSKPYGYEKSVDVQKIKRTLEDLSLILYKKIKPDVMTGNIVKLIDLSKIKLTFENNEFILTKIDDENLNKADFNLYELLFEVIGDGKNVTLSQIEKFCDKKSGNSDFLTNYKVWEKVSLKCSNKHIFFEEKKEYTIVKWMRNIGVLFFILNILLKIYNIYGFLIIIPAFLVSTYFFNISKLKNEYQQEYYSWLEFRGEIRKNKALLDSNLLLEYSVILRCYDCVNENRKRLFIKRLDSAIRKCYINSIFKGDRSLF